MRPKGLVAVDEERIAQVMEETPEVIAAYLFGSAARGETDQFNNDSSTKQWWSQSHHCGIENMFWPRQVTCLPMNRNRTIVGLKRYLVSEIYHGIEQEVNGFRRWRDQIVQILQTLG